MFTIKFYGDGGFRQVIKEAESFTILRDEDGCAEITLHQKAGIDDARIDISDSPRPIDAPPAFAKAIIENAAGRTTEIIEVGRFVHGLAPRTKAA
jgi:hypothetical protein